MKMDSLLLLKSSILVSFIVLLSSCATNKKSTSYKPDAYTKAVNTALEFAGKREYDKAKKVLLEAMAKGKVRKSPFVENDVLQFYSNNSTNTLMQLMYVAAFNSVKEKDSVRKNPGIYKELFEIYEKTPWKNAIVIEPSFPMLYWTMGVINIDDGDYNKAIAYLDTTIYMWKEYALAHSELMYVYMQKGDLKKAKEIGENALKIDAVGFDSTGKAAILRKLGYVAVEEYELEQAEKYYRESLKYQEHNTAREELKYIIKMKKK